MVVVTGTSGYADFSYVSSAGVTHADKNIFGNGFAIDSIESSEGIQPITELNNVEQARYAAGQRIRRIGCSWILSSPWFLHCLFGYDSRATATSGGSKAYTYTAKKIPQEFDFRIGIDYPSGDDIVRTFKKCIMGSTSLGARIGGQVQARASIETGDEAAITSAAAPRANVGSDSVDHPFVFAEATVSRGAQLIGTDMQNVSIQINPNQTLLYGLGQPQSVDSYKALMEYSGSFEIPLDDNTFYDLVLARDENSQALTVKFTNGEAGAAEKKIEFTFTGIAYRSHAVGGIRGTDPIFQTVDFTARSCTAVGTLPATIAAPDVT